MTFTNPHPASRLTLDGTNSLSSGLVGFWPLTDGGSSTTAKDITSNANDGTGQGGVNWDSSSIGTVFASDKTTDSYFVSNYSASGQSAISLSFWFIYNFDGDSPTGWNGLFRNGDSSNNLLQVYHHNTDHELRFGVATAGGGTGFNTAESGSWTTGAVYHAVFTYDGTTGKVYLNGSEQSSGTHSSPGNIKTVASQPFNIGVAVIPPDASATGSTTLDGDLQNVRVYNRALSATEVATLYHRPWEGTNYGDLWPYSPPAPADATLSTDTAATNLMSGCVGWWPLTDGSGSSPADVSGNSETLTNGGSSEWGVQSVGNVAVTNNNTGAYYSTDSAFSTMIGGSTPATDPWTISFWSSLYVTAPFYYEDGVFSIGSSANDGSPFLLVQRHGSLFRVNWGGAYVNISGVSNRTWANVTITFDGTTMNCYVDGSLGGTRASAGVNGSTSDKLWIGTGYNNNNTAPDDYFQNVRIWNRALSTDEITLLAERPFEGIEYGDEFHYDPPTPANLTPLDNSSGINTDCVGWWPLTETDDYASGAADISGNANNGTQSGGVLSEVSRLGGVASFDGFDDIIDASAYTIASTSSMTMAAWIRYTSTVGSVSVLNICNAGGGTTAQYTRNIAVTPSGNAACNVQSGTVVAQAVGSTVFDIGEWYFVVGTFDKVGTSYDVEIFVNGVSEATASGTGSELTPYTNTCIGGARRYNNAITAVEPCEIHNARIWDRILTAEEVWSIYQNPWLGSAYSDAAAVIYNYILRSKRFRRL